MKRERDRQTDSQQEAQAQKKVVIEILSDSDDDIAMQKGKGDKFKNAQREGGRTLEKTQASTVALIPPDETWEVLQVDTHTTPPPPPTHPPTPNPQPPFLEACSSLECDIQMGVFGS